MPINSGHISYINKISGLGSITINFYVLADSATDIKVRFSEAKSARETERLSNELIPAQPSRPKILGAKVPFTKNYNDKSISNTPWPKTDHNIKYVGSTRGQKKFLVSLFPLRYSINKKDYHLHKNISVTVKNSINKNIPKSNIKKEAFAFVIGQQYKESDSLRRYIEFKRQIGFHPVVLVVGEDVTTSEDIRAALKEIYFNDDLNLQYALLIGDIDDVPGHRPSFITTGVTDHYYRTLDIESYEDDINAPDIGVGRISAANEEQLKIILNKYTNYQTGDFADTEWLNSISFLATDDRWELAEGTHNHAIDNYFAPQGYTGVFPENPMLGGDRLYAITHRVANSTVHQTINQGRTIINYSGHGAHTFWDAPGVTQQDVRNLNHSSARPFVISNACITGDFTKDESFAETWQRHGKGAILFWGSMDNTYWDEDDILEKAMYRGIFEHGNRHFRSITQYALQEHFRHYGGAGRSKYYWETYIPFGDPSVRLRLKRPSQIALNGPAVLPMGVEEVAYTVLDDTGAAIVGAKVALTSPEMSVNGYTDQTGTIALDIAGAIVGTNFTVTIYANDTILKKGQLKIIASSTPYLLFAQISNSGAQLSDVVTGQKINLNFNVKNASNAPTSGATLKLSRVSGPVEILSSSLTIEALGSNQTLNYSGEALSFKAIPGSDMAPIVLSLDWKTQEGMSGKKRFNLNLVNGVLTLSQIDFGNPDASEIGGIGAGDQGAIFLSFRNDGHHAITNAQIDLQAGNCLSNVANSPINIDQLDPGQTIRLEEPLQVTVTAACQVKDHAQLIVSGNYSNGFSSIDLASDNFFMVGLFGSSHFAQSEIGLGIEDKTTSYFDFTIAQDIKSIEDITVAIDITHTYIGDLTVSIISPAGTKIVLHNNGGAGNDNINEVYTLSSTAALQQLLGESSFGEWRIKIDDRAASDVGTLDQLKIELKGYMQ